MLAIVAARLSDSEMGDSGQVEEGVPSGEKEGRKSTSLHVLPAFVCPHDPFETEPLCGPVFEGAIRVARKAVKRAED
jgi:hypothetical protein